MAVVDSFQHFGNAHLQFDNGGEVDAFSVVAYPGAPETTAPVLSGVSPVTGSTILATDALDFNVTDNLGELSAITVSIIFGSGLAEVVYDGSFRGEYVASSTKTPIANGFAFHIIRAAGWSNAAVSIRVVAVDNDGNALVSTFASYTCSNPTGSVPATVTLLNLSPTDGSSIDPSTPLVFDVRSLNPITRVIATVRFAGLRFREVAFEGDPASADAFEEAYSARSSKQTVTDGLYYRYRFSLMREEGVWLGSPELRVVAFNTDGNEV